MKILPLFALLLSTTAFAAPTPAKDIVDANKEVGPTIFEMSRPAMARFYVSVAEHEYAIKDETKNQSAAPVKAEKKK